MMNDERQRSQVVMDKVEAERDLKNRTKLFALRIIRLYSSLEKNAAAQVLGRQMLRSGTSVGAHYREAYRGRSSAEFISKMEVAVQELDETSYWIELLVESKCVAGSRVAPLRDEAEQLMAIFVASVTTCKRNKPK